MSKILYYICGWESLCWWDNAKTDNYMTPEKENSQRSKGRESQARETAGSKTLFGLLKEFKEKKNTKLLWVKLITLKESMKGVNVEELVTG